MVNVVETLNGSEHDGRDLLNDDMDFMLSQVAENISFFFFIEIENFRGEGKILMRHTHDTTFSENILDFLQNFRRERTVFHFYFF